jgi:hypothetical protein
LKNFNYFTYATLLEKEMSKINCQMKKIPQKKFKKDIKRISRMMTLDKVQEILLKDKKNSFESLEDLIDRKRDKALNKVLK